MAIQTNLWKNRCVKKTSRHPWLKTNAFNTQVISWTSCPPPQLHLFALPCPCVAVIFWTTEGSDHLFPIHVKGQTTSFGSFFLLGHFGFVLLPEKGQTTSLPPMPCPTNKYNV